MGVFDALPGKVGPVRITALHCYRIAPTAVQEIEKYRAFGAFRA